MCRKDLGRLRLLPLLAAALAGTACSEVTGPSGIQPGFERGGEGRFGTPTLIVSARIARGRTVDPKVLSDSLADTLARKESRFKSTSPRVIDVDTTGRLIARALGTASIIVNLDGAFDTVAVEVIDGLRQSFVEVPAGFTIRAVNDSGDVLGSGSDGTMLLTRSGRVSAVAGCVQPKDINNAGTIACDSGPYTVPVLISNGTSVPLLPDTLAGVVRAVDDAGRAFGVWWRPGSPSGASGFFFGRPGQLELFGPWCSWGGTQCVALLLNNRATRVYGKQESYNTPVWMMRADSLIPVGDASGRPWGSHHTYDRYFALNDRDDLLMADVRREPDYVYYQTPRIRWGQPAPTLTAEWDRGLTRCNYPYGITNRRTLVGVGRDGWCALEIDGRYTLLWDALRVEPQSEWHTLWTDDARYTRSGTIVMTATAPGGRKAVTFVEVE